MLMLMMVTLTWLMVVVAGERRFDDGRDDDVDNYDNAYITSSCTPITSPVVCL